MISELTALFDVAVSRTLIVRLARQNAWRRGGSEIRGSYSWRKRHRPWRAAAPISARSSSAPNDRMKSRPASRIKATCWPVLRISRVTTSRGTEPSSLARLVGRNAKDRSLVQYRQCAAMRREAIERPRTDFGDPSSGPEISSRAGVAAPDSMRLRMERACHPGSTVLEQTRPKRNDDGEDDCDRRVVATGINSANFTAPDILLRAAT